MLETVVVACICGLVALVVVWAIVNRVRFYRSSSGALRRAAKRGDAEAARTSLAAGADIEEARALHFAAERGHLHIAQLLLDHGASVDGNQLDTPLSTAAARGHLQIVRLLLDRGASVDGKAGTIDGPLSPVYVPTPLYLAALKGHPEIAHFLLERSASVTKDHIPVLYPAALRRDERLVQALLAKGANPEQDIPKIRLNETYGGEYVDGGMRSGLVKQLVKETLDGAVPQPCCICQAVGPGVSRDFVATRRVVNSHLSGTGRVTQTASRWIATKSFFACPSCIKKNERQSEGRPENLGVKLLGPLARAWVEESRPTFEQVPLPRPCLPGGLRGVGVTTATSYYGSCRSYFRWSWQDGQRGHGSGLL